MTDEIDEVTNNEFFLRPRFRLDFDENQDELMTKFENNLKSSDCKYCSKIVDKHIIIDVPIEEDHFWSPQLSIEIVKGEETASVVKGLFGPKPQVWTLFMFLHFVGGTLFIVALVLLYVWWTLDKSLIFPTTIVIMTPIIWFLLYFIGRLGKRKGREQMEELHGFMMDTLGK